MATEQRLIDANEAYEIARTSGLHDDFGRCMADLTSLRELLEDVPTRGCRGGGAVPGL